MENQQTIHKHLIKQSQKGDQSAMSSLYGLYVNAMYNICRRMIGEEEAKDILQESFVDAFQKLPTLREVNTFSSWLKRIVINNCINAIRKKKIDTTELEDNADFEEEVIDDFEYNNFKASQIMEAINYLPNGSKTVLNLYLFEGYDHKEIGQILEITESASKAQYSKAKAKIRKILEEERRLYAG